jgi:PleD family two-component response regulator
MDVEEAFKVFETIRKEVGAKSFDEVDIKITISGEITSWDGNSMGELIARVDKLLYMAKGRGRNCGVKKSKKQEEYFLF